MFKNLTIKARLIFLIGLMSVLLIGIGVVGLRGMNASNAALGTVYADRLIPSNQLGVINNLMAENVRQVHLSSMHDPRLPESKLHDHPLTFHSDKIKENIQKISDIWKEYMATYLTPEEKTLAEEYAEKRKIFVQQGLLGAVDLFATGNYAGGNEHLVKVVGPTYAEAKGLAEKLLQLQVDVGKEEFETAERNYATTRNWAIGAITVGVALALLIGILLIRNIGRSLGQAMGVAAKIAEGDLSSRIDIQQHDETGKLLESMQVMQAALTKLVGDVRRIVEAANQGDFSVKLETATHQGFAKDIATGLNQLSDTSEVALKDVTRVAQALAAGDLTQKITQEYPGLFDQTKQGINGTVDALTKIVAEIQAIVDAAANRGDFSIKMDMSGKAGYTQTLSELLNRLSDVTEGGLKDITRVANALAAGDLSQKITKDYPGLFDQTKQGVNGTADALAKIVAEIQQIVEAAAVRGDFSIKMDMSGKAGYTQTLSELLNQLSDVTDVALNDVMRVAQALAQGDLTQTIAQDYPGVFGQTKDGINATVTNLKQLVIQIKEAVDAINTAAKEIASGNQDLSQRTEEQASSLEETASSMEELTSTVKQNAENAKQANQLAAGSSDIAAKGGNVVRASVQTMVEISDSSKKIADIIGVIDGIAFQTNILALNAAVEAARAGEQGRGFAVVAAEVRNLAQRSANAAKEIKILITDSVSKVGSGTQQVNEAGRTMEEIVTSIKRVTDIMAEISAASVEQSSGIEQVNQAITQMDEVTQQNAALVEEAAAAAESLEEQAEGLARAVSVFKLDTHLAVSKPKAEARKPEAKAKPPAHAKVEHAHAKVEHAAPKRALPPKAGEEDWQEF